MGRFYAQTAGLSLRRVIGGRPRGNLAVPPSLAPSRSNPGMWYPRRAWWSPPAQAPAAAAAIGPAPAPRSRSTVGDSRNLPTTQTLPIALISMRDRWRGAPAAHPAGGVPARPRRPFPRHLRTIRTLVGAPPLM